MNDELRAELVRQSSAIVRDYLTTNSVAPDDLPQLISSIYRSLETPDQPKFQIDSGAIVAGVTEGVSGAILEGMERIAVGMGEMLQTLLEARPGPSLEALEPITPEPPQEVIDAAIQPDTIKVPSLTPEEIAATVTHDHITCLECGQPKKIMKAHLRNRHQMTPEQYLAKWSLPANYPLVAESHSDVIRERGYLATFNAERAAARRADAPEIEFTRPTEEVATSITPEGLACFECDKVYHDLGRHVKLTHHLTSDEYRAKNGLPADYMMISPHRLDQVTAGSHKRRALANA